MKMTPSHITKEAQTHVKARCREQHCEMKIGRHISRKIIVDVENYWIENGKQGKVSDCLIVCRFLSRDRVAIVELKGRSPHVSAVVQKIQNVCDSIQELLENDFYHTHNFDFYPVLLSKSMSPIETKKLRACRITLDNFSGGIIREPCNISLEFIFGKYG